MAPTFVGYPKVFVVDAEGKPLLPCHPARARKLLKHGKAKIERGSPFTIRLNQSVENPTGVLRAKVDDGSKYVGIALVNEHTGEVVFRGVLLQRGDVSRLLTLRREYRRNRRYRAVRHRPWRGDNRKQMVPFPSIRQKKEAIVRVLADLSEIAPISGVDIELVSAGAREKPLRGKNAREKVLNRDRACVVCGATEKLHRHHLAPRAKGGSDTPRNQVLLCQDCHRKLHAGKLMLNRKGITFQWRTHAVLGKTYLLSLLSRFGEIRLAEGWQTSEWRERLNVPKSHGNDAAVLYPVGLLKFFGPEYRIWPIRRRKWENNPTKSSEERNGLRHWDVVCSVRAGKLVFGCVRSLKRRVVTLRTAVDDNFAVTYSKTKLVDRPRGLVYVPVW